MTLDLFASPLAQLMRQGAELVEIARAVRQPLSEVSRDGQVLTLRGEELRRVLVYRVRTSSILWMVMVPESAAGHLFEAYDSEQMTCEALASLLWRALGCR